MMCVLIDKVSAGGGGGVNVSLNLHLLSIFPIPPVGRIFEEE